MKIIKLLKRKLKKNKKILDNDYFFGKYKIALKTNHVLAKYQKDFPLYDRFLPLLCKNFEDLIVDVGANIGDTSIAIFSNNLKSFIVGVEPDPFFYNECIRNITNNELTDRFLGINKFVSTKVGAFSLEKSNTLSTGSISYNTNQSAENNSISFQQLMELIPSDKKMKFDILKIDTDGFDWDVLNSFINYSLCIKPRFVFFEMQSYLNNKGVYDIDRNQINDNYNASIVKLQALGYNNFCLFDNFGTHIKIAKSINEIFELNDYITRSQIYNAHSTIYYLDILAFSDQDLTFVNQVLNDFYFNR